MVAQSNEDTKMDVDELVTAVSRLSTVSHGGEGSPAVLSFGHRRGRGVPFGQKSQALGVGEVYLVVPKGRSLHHQQLNRLHCSDAPLNLPTLA
jgi:hypothetical protein